MAAREAARWAWRARAVFRAATASTATASTAAARSGDGASSLRRIFDVTESAASGGRLRGCRPWVSVRTPSSDATTVRSFGCGYRSAAAPSLASIRPTIGARAFATAANDAPRSETGGDENDRSSSAKHERVCRETSKRRADRLNARLHRRAKETARRLRSKKRQSLTGIREWIAANADRLDRFTAHLACRLLAQHSARVARRARDERNGVFSLGGGKWRTRVEPSEPTSNEEEEEEEEAALVTLNGTSSRVIHGAIARIAGEVTNAHEWSRLLDGAAALARAGVTCGDDATSLVKASFEEASTVNKKNKKNAAVNKKISPTRSLTLSDAALWHVTSRGARFAASASPADVLTNLKALAAIAETRPGAVCPAGAAGVSRAAYARAVEWSDFELKSAEGTLDALVAFAKKEEVVYGVPLRDASRDAANDPPDTLSVTGTVADVPNVPNVPIPNTHVESPNPKKKRRRRKKTNEDERSESAFGNGGNSRDKKVNVPVATRHAFAEGFDAARALVRAVAAARADGTLMSVARARGGVAKKAGDDAGTSQFARRKKPKRTPKPKPKPSL